MIGVGEFEHLPETVGSTYEFGDRCVFEPEAPGGGDVALDQAGEQDAGRSAVAKDGGVGFGPVEFFLEFFQPSPDVADGLSIIRTDVVFGEFLDAGLGGEIGSDLGVVGTFELAKGALAENFSGLDFDAFDFGERGWRFGRSV